MAFNLVRYSQQDPQWKGNVIGGGPDTIGYIGCALTSLAMYASGWGFTETPATLNQKLTSNGGFTTDEALIWGAITRFHPQIKSTGLTFCGTSTAPAPLAQIDANLSAGNPVIVEIDYSPDAGLQTHWVLIYAKQGNDYLIQDPWPNPPETQQVTLLSRFSQGKPLQQAIKAIAWYECSAGPAVPPTTPGGSTSTTPSTTPSTPPSTPPATPSTPPASTVPATPATPPAAPVSTDLVLEVVPSATAGIKLHIGPSADSTADYAEMPGMPLNVIEDKAGAMAKLGKSNQFIYVRDPNGHQGYVAAWYVQVSSTSTPAPTPVPASTPATPPAPPASTPSAPPPSPAPIPSAPPASGPERLQVVVVQSVGPGGLAVRQQPSQGADKVHDEKAGARLTVIEPPNTALPKIGHAGQWLAVKATNNQRGYVMAQYVQLRQ